VFAVIYRWEVDPDREEQFQAGWRRCSTALQSTFGSYGSRLHRSDDGLWVAYGRWPDAAARDPYREHLDFDRPSFELMQGSIRRELPEMRLQIVEDLLDEPIRSVR
jgi:hypothetical protein